MTHQEKEALLKRIYALPTEWADAGGSYGKGGPAGSGDAAMLWPEVVIDAIDQFAEDTNVPVKQPDPITGLAPCGCGGDAVRNGMSFFYAYITSCSECGTLAWSKTSQQEADNNWNTAMGYTAPPLPGAIGPDAGEMAPNGEEE